MVNLKINENIFTIINIYAPNDKHNRNRFFKKINKQITEFQQGPIIIGGDWNDIQEHIDRKSVRKIQKCVHNLKTLKKELKLIDMWRLKNPHKQQFTWRRKTQIQKLVELIIF